RMENLVNTPTLQGPTGATGPTGPTGPAGGPTGPTGPTGPAGSGLGGLVEFDPIVAPTYPLNQVVYYNGSTYMVVSTPPSGTPDSSPDYVLIAARGATGATGASGATGATG